MNKDSLMHKFTAEQRKVIRTKVKNVEVLAYPGTGKTKTLVARIHRLVQQGISANQILVLSFSNTAVDILIERLEGIVKVQTFHAFAKGLVPGKKRQLMTPTRQLALVQETIKKSPAQRREVRHQIGVKLREHRESQRLSAFYTRMQGDRALARAMVNDPNSEFHVYRPVLVPLLKMYRRYCKRKDAAALIDYPDMLRLGCKVLEQCHDLPYQYLFIDECQDMNRGQAAILRGLATLIPNVMVFGDPFQSVFGFAGGRYWQLSSLLDNVRTYSLTHSFRLTQCNADIASALIAPCVDAPPRLIGRAPGRKPAFMHCTTSDEQTQQAIKVVQKIIRNGASADGIAILARTKAQLRDVEIGLLDAGYPIQQRHRQGAPEQVDTLLAILALLEKHAARVMSHQKISAKKLARRLLNAAGLKGRAIDPKAVAACRRKLDKAILSPSLEGRYIGARKIYEKLLRTQNSLTDDLRAELGRWEPLCARFACAAELREYIDALRKQPAVTTSTIHGAKGGEWDHVLVLYVTDGSLPYHREIARGELDEERRLLYVAASRPKERLFLFHAPYHHARSSKRYEEPSRFLTHRVRRLLKIA